MGKVVHRRKEKLQYRGNCTQFDVIKQATTVRTFDKRIWSNHGEGYFVCITEDQNGSIRSEVVQLAKIYRNIQTVVAKNLVIARRNHPNWALRFLVNPYVIRHRK
ncbi:hypothetical protein A5819_003477 [Enterococcus sp. 7E2_DIV0204]|uniref:hypothetical protein n=1 Tax=unclassified Enterococcus TaxID=2608891 RepID=UPI000A335B0D|nr:MULTISPECIES: hypothetical protein [unclassified Enterococcus]OTN83927.1 hypothetical protein A5819_003477 [Enterococcus sp. 7E2_DIV0204]OTP46835.1 hypothetical protein A5884_003713 [Enterococcus sp. 7D2_DIV0200]